MKPHKHAELIKAWADGVKIQFKRPEEFEWEDCGNSPRWFENFHYRIKPQPKPDVVATGIIEWTGTTVRDVAEYSTSFRVSEHYERNNIQFIFDGETGKLKSAEVING